MSAKDASTKLNIEKPWFRQRAFRTQFMRSEYGRIFMLGCLLLIGGVSVIGLLVTYSHPAWQNIFTMAVAHMVAGKGVSVVQGLALGLHPAAILALATLSDLILMLIAYPVFVFSYEHFVETHLFQNHMNRVFESARRRVDRVGRFKALGVFVFVWLPLWMTGVLVGSILGYLLGLRSWVTLSAAALGTFTSIVAWLLFSQQILMMVGWVDDRAAAVAVVIMLIGLLAWRRVKRRRSASRKARRNS